MLYGEGTSQARTATQGTVLCVALSVTDSAGRDNKLHLQHALAPAQSLLVQINSIKATQGTVLCVA